MSEIDPSLRLIESRSPLKAYFGTSLRTRAVMTLGLAFSFVGLLFAWLVVADLTDRIETVSEKLLSDAKLIAAPEENIISRGDGILNGMGLRRELELDSSQDGCKLFLTDRVDREPVFESAAVMNVDGSVRCTSLPAPSWHSDPSDAFHQQILRSGGTSVSNVLIADGTQIVLLGKTMQNSEGRVTGVAVLALNLDWLRQDAMRAVLPIGGRISLIDGTSRVLIRHPDPDGLAGQRLPESRIIRKVLANPAAGTFEEVGIYGERRIVAHVPFLTSAVGSRYQLLVSVPRQVVVGETQARAAKIFGFLLLVLLGVMVALIIGTNKALLNPLARLTEASLQLEHGNLTARSGLKHGSDEIGRLAQRFDESAAAIEKRELELIVKAAMLDNANDAITVRDLSNRITFWNPAAETLYGWAEKDALGKHFPDLLKADPKKFNEAKLTIHQFGQWSGEIEKHDRDGRLLTILGSWTLIKDTAGNPVSILSIDSDVSERHLADLSLRDSEERFRSLAESISEIFWIIDAERTKCMYVSPAFEMIMGRKCQELYDNPNVWADAIHPEDRTHVLAAADAGQFNGTYDETYRILHTDGTVRWLHERAFPVRDENGTIQRIVGTAADVTQRQLIEEQLHQSQKMEAIGRLAGGIAHDFNNLLVVISGYTEILMDREDLADDALLALGAVYQAADRAGALTAQLLAFSRKSLMKPQVIDLNNSVRDMGDMLTRLIGEDITYTTVLSANLDPVVFDPGLLGQVLMNLAVNARDAMPDGGRLTVETGNIYMEEDIVRADRKPGPYVMLAMTDTGIGMTADIRERIFEPFFTTKEVGKGTGLGLSMVLGIVQQSGGFVGIYSEPGYGTTIKVFLPSVQSELTPIRRPQPTENLDGTETILLVEDEAAVRDLIKIGLERLGYKLLIAVDGQDALRLLETSVEPIDLVLTDVIMPNLSGPGLVAQMKERRPSVKVLFMSGYTDDVVVRHGLLNANVSFIQKPFTWKGLGQKLRTLFERGTNV